MSLESSSIIYENDLFYVEVEASSIPWLKLFAKKRVKELSFMTQQERYMLFDMSHAIESVMIAHYNPDKINLASFGNYLPQVHMHIMARFQEDAFFPEPMWGTRQREDKDLKGDFEGFIQKIQRALKDFS